MVIKGMIKHMIFIQVVYFHLSDVFILPKISYQTDICLRILNIVVCACSLNPN